MSEFETADEALGEHAKLIPPGLEGWFFVGSFDARSVKDRATAQAFVETLTREFGNATSLINLYHGRTGEVVQQLLLIRPDGYVPVRAWEMLQLLDRGEVLDQDILDEVIDAEVSRRWNKASAFDRLDWHIEAGQSLTAVLYEEPPGTIATLLYREISEED